ncbi:MAG TPA: NUDIX domain-containing protein [Dehalococcoidia bacterium]|nr:NUDIX domain-containing protein [Dehalococcoidia bacterium]
MDSRSVVTCFLEAGGRILIVRRGWRVSTYRGRWSAISGGIDPGCTPEDQAWLEVGEETSLIPPDVELVVAGEPFSFEDADLDRRWTVHPYRFAARRPEGVRLDWENVEARWIDPADLARVSTVPRLQEAWDRVAPPRPWPGEIQAGLDHLRRDRTSGASELVESLLSTLESAAGSLPASSWGDLRNGLTALARDLGRARPTITPLRYWSGRFVSELSGVDGLGTRSFRAPAASLARSLISEARRARDRAIATAASLIPRGATVATASYSSLVVAALRTAGQAGRILALASVGPGGRRYGDLVAERLGACVAPVEVWEDDQVAMVAGAADLVLLGADAVRPDRSIVNGVPSRALAEAAAARGRPIYAIAPRDRFIEAPVEPIKPGFEVVPAGLLTGIISEECGDDHRSRRTGAT